MISQDLNSGTDSFERTVSWVEEKAGRPLTNREVRELADHIRAIVRDGLIAAQSLMHP
jgi:hypothetical protein